MLYEGCGASTWERVSKGLTDKVGEVMVYVTLTDLAKPDQDNGLPPGSNLGI